jgi:GTPase SAR1 family protein
MNTRKQAWMNAAQRFSDLLDAQGDERRASLVRLVVNRLAVPQAYVTVVGETSTGKSSLINALLSEEHLPVSGKPTTGVVTHVACRDEAEPRFFAIYRDATQEEIDRARFVEQSLTPDDEILRLQIRVRPKAPSHVGMHVFDTPGYNAVMSRHEEVLMAFLPQSDVIVFVVGYRTGFGQTEQDLFEAVAEATANDPHIPVMLVINRAREGCGRADKRVDEIMRLAQDALKRPLSLQIIHSTNFRAPNATLERRPLAAERLWDEVSGHAFAPELLKAVEARLANAVLATLAEVDAALEREEAGLSANADEREAIERAMEVTRSAHARSLQEIDATMTRLETALPRLVDKVTDAALRRIEADIMASNKWLGYADCAQWISGHCLPFEVRQIGRAIENHITVEMEDLNRRLEDIANTAVAELDKTVALRSGDPVSKFVTSLAATLAQRVAGNAANSMLRGLGGVGGAAAGAGNLAKMAVSRIGKLFGQRFGREVYNQIGRVFTKKMLERLNVALTVIVEVVGFVYEAQVWQGKLLALSREAIGEWREVVGNDLRDEHLPGMRQGNRDIIDALYGDLEAQPALHAEPDQRLVEVRSFRQQLASLRQQLHPTLNA